MTRSWRVVQMSALSLAGLACGVEQTAPPPQPYYVVIETQPDTMIVPNTLQFRATVHDVTGAVLDGEPVTWSTTDSTILQIDPTGMATVTRPGRVVVQAAARAGTAGSAFIMVLPRVTDLRVTPDTLTLLAGAAEGLFAVRRDSTGAVLSGRPLTWIGANPAIASIDTTLEPGGRLARITALSAGTESIFVQVEAAIDSVVVRVIPTLQFDSLSVGRVSACGLTHAGAVFCWGRGIEGELGNGDHHDNPYPVGVYGGLRFQSIRVGDGYDCGITVAGLAYCWGADSLGRAYSGLPADRSTAKLVTPSLTFLAVSAGIDHACGIATGGAVYCWGNNRWGQLGQGDASPRANPVPIVGGHLFVDIVSGWDFSCGRELIGLVWCWGVNAAPYGSDSSAVASCAGGPCVLVPAVAADSARFNSIRAGEGAICGVTTTGSSLCWGIRFGPVVDMSDGHSFTVMTPGEQHACALDVSGQAWCQGYNTYGEFGDGKTGEISIPFVQVLGGYVFSWLGAGGGFTCGLATDSNAYCWGGNGSGQLGIGSTDARRTLPVKVAGQP